MPVPAREPSPGAAVPDDADAVPGIVAAAVTQAGSARGDAAVLPEFAYGEGGLRSFGWALIGRIGNQALQIVGTIVIGRIVAPDQFGIYAAGAVVVALGLIFTDLGIGPAVVARATLHRSFLETAFWVNAASGVTLSLLAVAVAWPLSWWYGYDDLVWVVPVQGLAFTLSVSTVGLALMERRFRFRAISVIDFGAVLVGQACAVVVALLDPTVLALALAPVVTAGTSSLLVLGTGGWRPRLRPRINRRDLRDLAGFSGFLSLFNLTSFAARNSDDFFLGHFVGAAALGFYARSYQLMLLPISQVTQALSRVLQPAFAQRRDSVGSLQGLYTRAGLAAAAVGLLAAAVLVPLAPSGIPFLLGPNWTPMVPIFQLFALSIPTQVLGAVNGPLYTATANVRLLLASGAVSSGLLVAAFVITAPFGTTAVAVAFVLHSLVTLPIAAWPILRRLRLRFRPLLPGLLALAAATGVLYLGLEFLPTWVGHRDGSTVRLLLQVGVLGVALVAVLLVARARGLLSRDGLHRVLGSA